MASSDKKADKKTIHDYEIYGSFFIDTFYNSLYSYAKTAKKEGKYNTVTDAYTIITKNWISSLDKSLPNNFLPKEFDKLLEKFALWIAEHKCLTAVPTMEIFKSVVFSFIPSEYTNELNDKHILTSIKEIVFDIAVSLASFVLNEFKNNIIDRHNDYETNYIIMKEKVLTIQYIIREKWILKFIGNINNQKVDKLQINEMTTKYKRLESDFLELNELYEKKMQEIKTITDQYTRAIEIVEKLKNKVILDSKNINMLKEENTKLKYQLEKNTQHDPEPEYSETRDQISEMYNNDNEIEIIPIEVPEVKNTRKKKVVFDYDDE